MGAGGGGAVARAIPSSGSGNGSGSSSFISNLSPVCFYFEVRSWGGVWVWIWVLGMSLEAGL